jgi:cytochrome d ubiquinol oxidase subunit II
MSTLALATACAGLIGMGLIAYAVMGGADFGGGIWDLFATGRLAERQRQAIANALGPVWEANNVWLIYVIVVTWTAFPPVYATVSTALFIPVVLALIGIIFRGAAFGFLSHYGRRAGMASIWGRVFSVASTITPFLLGMIAGAIAGGAITLTHGSAVNVNYWTVWISPFSFACGAFAVGLCSVLAATYLTVEARTAGDMPLVAAFRQRAIVAGAVTALLGAIAAVVAEYQAPLLWSGLVGSALPLSLGAVLIGLATAAALLLGFYQSARLLVAAETACIFAAWAIAQYPYLIIPSLTLTNAASPRPVLLAAVLASLAGMVILLPSLWYLFTIFKGPRGTPRLTAAKLADEGLRRAFADRDRVAPAPVGPPPPTPTARPPVRAVAASSRAAQPEGQPRVRSSTAWLTAALAAAAIVPVVVWLGRQLWRAIRALAGLLRWPGGGHHAGAS